MRLEIEEAALRKEKDNASIQRLANLQKELVDLRNEVYSLREQYEGEKKIHKTGPNIAKRHRSNTTRNPRG